MRTAMDGTLRSAAHALRGRLRSLGVASYVLASLKRELRDFNLTTGGWK